MTPFTAETTVEDISKVSISNLCACSGLIFQFCKPEVIKAAMVRVFSEGTRSNCADYLENQHKLLIAQVNTCKEMCGLTAKLYAAAGAPEDEVKDAVKSAVLEVYKVRPDRADVVTGSLVVEPVC